MKQPADFQDPTIASLPTRSWPLQTVYGGALALILSVVTAIFPAINRLDSPEVVWFPLPMIAVGLGAVVVCHRLSARSHIVGRNRSMYKHLLLGSIAIAGLTAIGLALTGLSALRHGHASLHGDYWDAPTHFRNVYSITLGFVEGLTEEVSVRGVVQIPITGRLGSIRAQIVAGALFVILHMFTRTGISEFVFVGLTTVVCGLLTAVLRSVWVPAVVHGTTNTLIALIVLAFRR